MAKTICPVCRKPVGMWAAYDHPDTTVTHVACQWDYRDMLARKQNGDSSSASNVERDTSMQQPSEDSFGGSQESFRSSPDAPSITIFFYILATVFIAGGFFLCVQLMPEAPPKGHEWTMQAYVPAIATFVAGCVQAAIFAAIGRGLHYLDEIADNTRTPRS